jgi:predicted  nucleic acid-binding Zn-ribbon protein
MSLTKQDLQAIKGVVDNSIDDAITNRIQPMISEAVEELRLQIAVGFAGVDERFAEVDRRFEQVDKRFEQIDLRFEQIDLRFEQVDQRFDHMDKRFDRMEKRQSDIEEYDIRFRRLEKYTGLSPA